jgi:hypothetical protein
MNCDCDICPEKSCWDWLVSERGVYASCPLNNLYFWETLAKRKNYGNHLSGHWWPHCFPGDEGFSSLNFPKVSIGLFANLNALDARKGGGLVGKSSKTREESYAST